MDSRQTPDIAEINAEVAKIKWMVSKLYDRLVIPKSMIEIVVPIVNIDNILPISDPVEVPAEKTREEKRLRKRKKHKEKEAKKMPR